MYRRVCYLSSRKRRSLQSSRETKSVSSGFARVSLPSQRTRFTVSHVKSKIKTDENPEEAFPILYYTPVRWRPFPRSAIDFVKGLRVGFTHYHARRRYRLVSQKNISNLNHLIPLGMNFLNRLRLLPVFTSLRFYQAK